jgi:hypothetical protein
VLPAVTRLVVGRLQFPPDLLSARASVFTPLAGRLSASATIFTPSLLVHQLNPLAGVFDPPSVGRARPLEEANNILSPADDAMISSPVPFTSQVFMDDLQPTPVQPAALAAATQHCALSPETRALEANDLYEHWGSEPELAALPPPEPDPVSLHAPTTSTKDLALTRSTSSHAGNLPLVPRFSTGRPPDLRLRPEDRSVYSATPYTDRPPVNGLSSSPPLLVQPANATNARLATDLPLAAPTQRPSLPLPLAPSVRTLMTDEQTAAVTATHATTLSPDSAPPSATSASTLPPTSAPTTRVASEGEGSAANAVATVDADVNSGINLRTVAREASLPSPQNLHQFKQSGQRLSCPSAESQGPYC